MNSSRWVVPKVPSSFQKLSSDGVSSEHAARDGFSVSIHLATTRSASDVDELILELAAAALVLDALESIAEHCIRQHRSLPFSLSPFLSLY